MVAEGAALPARPVVARDFSRARDPGRGARLQPARRRRSTTSWTSTDERSEDILSIRDLSLRFALLRGLLARPQWRQPRLSGAASASRWSASSACGKTLTARSVIGLADLRRAEVSGEVSVFGKNVLDFRDKDWRGIRGNRLTMIFQDPFAALRRHASSKRRSCPTGLLEAAAILDARMRERDQALVAERVARARRASRTKRGSP